MKKKQAAQGDVLIEKVESLPQGDPVVIQDGVVALGEATGHKHRLEGKFRLMRFTGVAELFAEVQAGGAKLIHDEHSVINLDKGIYKFPLQREWVREAVRGVAD